MSTPGPWEWDDCEGDLTALRNRTGTYVLSTTSDRYGDMFIEISDESDAKLIAAAPDLLAALIDCTDRLETCARVGGNTEYVVAALIQQFRDVIARAKS